MSRPKHSESLEAAIRQHFGLTQEELARYLGVTRGQVAHLEAGRRTSTSAVSKRLWPLADLLPSPEAHGPVPPDFTVPAVPLLLLSPTLPDVGALPPAPLKKRQRLAGAQAAAIRYSLYLAGKREQLQRRRTWALYVFRAALLPATGTPAEQARLTHWLTTLAADINAAAPTPADEATRVIALLRLQLLDTEAATLGQLLQQS